MKPVTFWLNFVGLVLNFAAAVLLIVSFAAEPSAFRFITANGIDFGGKHYDGQSYFLCVEKFAFAGVSGQRALIGSQDCPEWINGKAAAVITLDHPNCATAAVIALFFAFLAQGVALVLERRTVRPTSPGS